MMKLMLQLMQWLIDMKLMIQWAVTSSALILIVLAVRQLFQSRLSARLKYALWGVVLLRLLVPFQVELPAAAPVLASNLAQDVTPWLDDTMLYALPTEDQPGGGVPEGLPPQYQRNGFPDYGWEYYTGGVVYDGGHVTRYALMLTALEVVILIWIAGTALTALVVLLSNLRFYSRLKKRRKRLEGADTPIPVYTAEGLPSPCLFGVLRPAVYVTPQAAEDQDTLRHVLAHELTHYAHKDHIWSLLRILALALHWYNPLAWLAVVFSKRDGELACDEGAVARLGEAERIPYGRTLVDMVAKRSLRPVDLLSCSTAMTGGKKSIQRRVAQLVKKPETVKAALFAAVALVALGLVFTFAGRGTAEQENKMLLDYLDRTTAIHYSPPTYSSTFYPNPITREDLLAQAKEALRSATPLGPEDPEPDRGTLIHASTVSLAMEDESKIYYTLLRQDNYTYVLEGAVRYWYEDTQQDPWYSAAFRSEEDIISILESLARQSPKEQTSYGSSELDRFLSELESARSIFVGQPMISSAAAPGLISDPEAVAQAKELLGKASGPLQLAEGVTREEFWKSIRPFLSSTEYQDMEELPTITQEDLKDMLFMRGKPIVLCPGTEVTPDAEYRYWLADHMLLLFDAELEENPKALATFSDDVYSQLAELARTNGSRYRVDAAEYPEALEELIRLFVNDEDFLFQNAQAENTTPEDIAAWLKGEGSEPIPPEMLIIHRGTWTLSAFGGGTHIFYNMTIPSHLITQIQHICQSYGVEISW